MQDPRSGLRRTSPQRGAQHLDQGIKQSRALFRRVDALRKPLETSQVIRRGPLMLDGERMQVQWQGQVVLQALHTLVS